MTDKILIAKVSGASGIKGGIKLFHYSGERERIEGIKELFFLPADMNGDFICGKVLSMRYKGKTPVLLVEGIGTREAAEALIGADVYADRNALAPLGEDSYYVDAIIGFAVVDERGGRMGELVGVIDNPAHDILRIASVGGDRELLLPMVDEFVLSVDVAARQIRVRPPDGLDGI